MTAQRVVLNVTEGKGAAVLTAGSVVSAGEVLIEFDDVDPQGDVEVTIRKIAEVLREQLY